MIDELVRISNQASRDILEVYNSDFAVRTKTDDSPVTQADLRAHETIVRELAMLDVAIPIVSEEGTFPDFSTRQQWKEYWLVDPLDGTRDFVERNGEFTVNIALIQGDRPALGIVNVPTRGCVYVGDCINSKAFVRNSTGQLSISSRTNDSHELVLVESRHNASRGNDLFADHLRRKGKRVVRESAGSSLKICRVAEGSADFYLRCGPTSEWDLAAAHAVLHAAGGNLRMLSGAPLLYNQKQSLLNPSFFACGDSPDYWTAELNAALQI